MKIAPIPGLVTGLFVLWMSSNMAFSQVNDPKSQVDTPLLDRELFFGNPQIAGGQLSPDGKVHFVHEALPGNHERVGEGVLAAVR